MEITWIHDLTEIDLAICTRKVAKSYKQRWNSPFQLIWSWCSIACTTEIGLSTQHLPHHSSEDWGSIGQCAVALKTRRWFTTQMSMTLLLQPKTDWFPHVLPIITKLPWTSYRNIYSLSNALFPVRGCHRGAPLRFPSKTLEMLIMSGLTPYQTLQDLLPQKSTKIWVYVIRVGGGRSLMWSTAPNCCYLGPVETIATGANWKQLYIDYGRLTLWNNQPTKPTPGMNHSTLEVKPTDKQIYSPQFWRIKISQTLENRTHLWKPIYFFNGRPELPGSCST